jgi:hypothetical protein
MPNVPDFSSVPGDAWTEQLMRFLQLGGNAPGVQGANPANLPSADASNMSVQVLGGDGGFAVPPAAPAPQQGPPGYLNSTSATPPPVMGPPQGPTPWFTGGNNPMPWRSPSPASTARPSPAAASTAAPAAPARAAAAPGVAKSPNLGYYPPNPRFGTMQSQVPGSGGGPLSNAPIYTTLNLFGGGAQPGPLAGGGRAPGGRYINPQPPGGPPDYGMAPIDITGYPVRGVNSPMPPTEPDDIRRRQRAIQLAAARSGFA